MRKTKGAIIKPLSKDRLRFLIKNHGLQTSMFDRSLLVFDWDGLEYQFYVNEGRLHLYNVKIQSDVILGVVAHVAIY